MYILRMKPLNVRTATYDFFVTLGQRFLNPNVGRQDFMNESRKAFFVNWINQNDVSSSVLSLLF